jgi:DNA-binding LacI/PurR family transcriptional regulator
MRDIMSEQKQSKKYSTIADIAEAAGVSISTVSKVLNKRTDVAPDTRERVEKIIEDVGFVRNRAARSLRSGNTGLIDLIVPRLDDDYYMPIIQGAEQALRKQGMRMVITTTYYEREQELEWLETISERATGGILLVLPSEQTLMQVELLQIPTVTIHHQGKIMEHDIPYVNFTSWIGGYTATKYLLDLGHRRVAYIGKDVHSFEAFERYNGYRSALEEVGIAPDPKLQGLGRFTVADGYTATQRLLELDNPPTAIFAGNDHQAIGVYQALYERKITIPDKISVIGFDDLAYSELMAPPLTTIHVPRLELGKVAATVLMRCIAGEQLETNHVILSTHLVERRSCTSLA